jgi:hypothetical protein
MKKKVAIMALLCASACAMNGYDDHSPRKMVDKRIEAVETTKKEEEEEKTGPIKQNLRQEQVSTKDPFEFLIELAEEPLKSQTDDYYERLKYSIDLWQASLKDPNQARETFRQASLKDPNQTRETFWQRSLKDYDQIVKDFIEYLKFDNIFERSSPVQELSNIKISREDALKALRTLTSNDIEDVKKRDQLDKEISRIFLSKRFYLHMHEILNLAHALKKSAIGISFFLNMAFGDSSPDTPQDPMLGHKLAREVHFFDMKKWNDSVDEIEEMMKKFMVSELDLINRPTDPSSQSNFKYLQDLEDAIKCCLDKMTEIPREDCYWSYRDFLGSWKGEVFCLLDDNKLTLPQIRESVGNTARAFADEKKIQFPNAGEEASIKAFFINLKKADRMWLLDHIRASCKELRDHIRASCKELRDRRLKDYLEKCRRRSEYKGFFHKS